MLRFTANLSMLFTELPLMRRFEAAKAHGFEAVEIQFPYELPVERIVSLLQEHELKLVLFNVDADTLLQGGEGLAAVPEKQAHFKAAVAQTLEYAKLLKPDVINVLPGRCFDALRFDDYRQALINNLRYAADCFADIGVITVFEAVNSQDMPGFIIDSSAGMLQMLDEVNHPNLRLQYDIYHMNRMQEDCAVFLRHYLDKVAHIQFADCPGRLQPGTGTIDFDALFKLIADSSYNGWLGAEYKTEGDTNATLDWFRRHQSNQTGQKPVR